MTTILGIDLQHIIMSEIQIDQEKLIISQSKLNMNSKNRPYHIRPIPVHDKLLDKYRNTNTYQVEHIQMKRGSHLNWDLDNYQLQLAYCIYKI